MKYDNDKYVDIGKVFVYLGINMTENLLKFHSLTGCDSTSYIYLENPEKIHLIDSLGLTKDLSTNDVENFQKFIKTVMYNGKEQEGYIETRVRLYKNQSTKTSISLPPDPDSCKQAIKRAHCQSYYWNNYIQYGLQVFSYHRHVQKRRKHRKSLR